MRRLRYEYGAGPLHLLGVLAMMLVVVYAALRIADVSQPRDVLVWFGGAIVAHDLVLFPLYATLALIVYRVGRALRRAGAAQVAWLNHVRVPAVLSGLLLLVWLPLIAGLGRESFVRAAGYEPDGYLTRWLLVTAAMFAASAVVYAYSVRRFRAPPTPAPKR